MKKDTVQQEILLVTTTTLLNRQLCARDDQGRNKQLSKSEQLEAACWNGLLNELLPDVMEKTASGQRLFLWHIRQGCSTLQIELSEFPLVVEREFSIDTVFFLPTLNIN